MNVLEAHHRLTIRVAALHVELAQVKISQARKRIAAYHSSEESSVSGRQRDADLAAIDLTCDVLDLEGDIASTNAKLSFLVELIHQQCLDWQLDVEDFG